MTKHEEFLDKLKERHPEILDKLTFVTEYIASKKDIIVNDGIGDLKTIPERLLLGKIPNIQAAIDKNKYFSTKANIIHNNKYTYEKLHYTNNKQNVVITCPIHGDFEQSADNHLAGKGCKKCGMLNIKEALKSTLEEFIEKANKIHNNKYDYSLVEYINSRTKIKIICPEHGEFEQVPTDHLSGCGCKICTRMGYFSNYRAAVHLEWKDINATVYLINCFSEDENFHKVGITTRKLYDRFAGNKLEYNYNSIYEFNTSLYNACFIEYDVHTILKDHKYIPLIKFKGGGECFKFDELEILNILKSTINKYEI